MVNSIRKTLDNKAILHGTSMHDIFQKIPYTITACRPILREFIRLLSSVEDHYRNFEKGFSLPFML